MDGEEASEQMSLAWLRQLVSTIPGASRRKRSLDGKLKEKSRDELVATIREFRRTGGGGEMLQPLAEQLDSDPSVAVREPIQSKDLELVQPDRGSVLEVTALTRNKEVPDQEYEAMSVTALRQLISGMPGVPGSGATSSSADTERPQPLAGFSSVVDAEFLLQWTTQSCTEQRHASRHVR